MNTQRHVVAELESLPTSPVVPEASASNGSSSSVGSKNGSAAEFVAPGPSDVEYRFQVAPRTVEDLVESMRGERSRAFTPLGEDMASASLELRLSGAECYRRLVCLRFDIDYTSLPLGSQKLFLLLREPRASESESSATQFELLKLAPQRRT
jgi:hypothetical protein